MFQNFFTRSVFSWHAAELFAWKFYFIESWKTSQNNDIHFVKISTIFSSHVKVYCILEVIQCNQMLFGRYLWGNSHSSVRIMKFGENTFFFFFGFVMLVVCVTVDATKQNSIKICASVLQMYILSILFSHKWFSNSGNLTVNLWCISVYLARLS